MEQGEASKNLCEMCGKEMNPSGRYAVPTQEGTKILRLCKSCCREFALRKAKITPAPTHLHRDLTGKNIGCWFMVAYAGQRDGSHYWRCMCRASLAEKIIAEREILDRKLNVVSEVPDHWDEAGKNPTGWIYGEWTVVGPASTPLKLRKKPGPFWKCRCICETERDIAQDDLQWGRMICCGCRPVAEVREELEWKKKLAREGWKKVCDAVHRRYREHQFDKNWTRDMEHALRRFQPSCVVCGNADHLTIHHVRPVSRGHGLEPGNAVRLCRACNSYICQREPGELFPDMAHKVETAAAQFKEHWESGCATSLAPAAIPTENKPQAPDPALITLLRAVECGDENAIPALADWLQAHDDPRASAVRDVTISVGICHVFEVWQRLGLSLNEMNTIRQYLGITADGIAAPIEQIAKLERKKEQTIRHRIDSALHQLTLPVRRVPGAPGGAWRALVGDAPPHGSKPERHR